MFYISYSTLKAQRKEEEQQNQLLLSCIKNFDFKTSGLYIYMIQYMYTIAININLIMIQYMYTISIIIRLMLPKNKPSSEMTCNLYESNR
jgi:hypothetical protein